MSVELLVMAKAPVPGRAKTRLAAGVGTAFAAELAAGALLDTIEVCSRTFPGRCHLALEGSLADAARSVEISAALGEWHVVAQQGHTFGERLAHGHRAVGRDAGRMTLQIGMDTPQVTREHLTRAASALEVGAQAVLGPATDGGWWLLGLADPRVASIVVDVPMSRTDTGARTLDALRRATGRGGAVAVVDALNDVDDTDDAEAVAAAIPDSRFGRLWASRVGVPS